MADERVLVTQQWLNETYGHIAGFGSVPENGKTGWPTIYGLIRGLQVEVGITDLVDSFGPTTAIKYDQFVTSNWGRNLGENFVYLIQGAFWCKGINPSYFNGVFSIELEDAVRELKSDAGFSNPNGILDSLWAKALFDMSAFVLVSGGDKKIRKMQQWMNVTYTSYTGIMPCDGIYQRDTNTSLIFALQSELGYDEDTATGSIGPGTTSAIYSVSEGATGNYVKIIQYGLYVNGYYQSGSFDGIFTSYMGSEIVDFRHFIILPEYTKIADKTVIIGLLSSAGYTYRPADGADTSTQLTPLQIQTLVDNDVKIIGRYLTGTVGIGENERPKNLTREELNNLFSAGISVFPIYQDGGWSENYFTEIQGVDDAKAAVEAAKTLGIPSATTIYFAVDVDIQDGDISATAMAYFKGINSYLPYFGYQIGVYGTRNVCTRIIDGMLARTAFVSDMSTGYSGNLGFAMPRQWAFDQFIEFTIGYGEGAVGIDNDSVSGKDDGFNTLSDGIDKELIYQYNQKVINQMLRAFQYLSTAELDNFWNPHLTFYRYTEYSGTSWDIISSPVSTHDRKIYDSYKKKLNEGEGMYTYFLDPNSGTQIGLAHLVVTLQSQMFITDVLYDRVSDFAGWAGDLMTCWGEVKKAGVQIRQGVYTLVGAKGGGTFSLVDLYQDVDAVNVFEISKLDSDDTALTSLSKYYVQGECVNRFSKFITNRFGSSSQIKIKTQDLLADNSNVDILGSGVIAYFIEKIVNPTLHTNFNYLTDFAGDEEEIATGFANKLIYFKNTEG